MQNILDSWANYSQEVLAWTVDKHYKSMPFASIASDDVQKNIAKLLEHGARRNAKWYVLLGCEHEAFCVSLAKQLLNEQADANVLLLETKPHLARAFCDAYGALPKNMHMLVDTSPWALYFLTLEYLTGICADDCIIHWMQGPRERDASLNTWRKLFLGAEKYHLPAKSKELMLSVGAIIHPDEPNLHEFFAHIPAWVYELVVVWDTSEDVQKFVTKFKCAAKVKHYARTLNNDFSAQRNTMLAQCSGNWLLYIDADERFEAEVWEQLGQIASIPELAGVYFPRLTFEGDTSHVRMGYGLWPDVQLRFFPLNAKVNFVGSVHERVEGLGTKFFLAPHAPLVHYSHVSKDAEQLRQRLATFNAAGSVEHTLSKAYPRLPWKFFDKWTKNINPFLIQLPR